MVKKIFILFMTLTSLLFSKEIKPVVFFDAKGPTDHGWNQAIYNGVKKFEKKSGIKVETVAVKSITDFNQKLKLYADKGYNPIMLSSIESSDQVIKPIMLKHSQTRFVIFNGTFNMPNAHYFTFSYQEASFLAGYLAIKKSKTHKIAFIGGMDTPALRNYLCGYIKGAKYADADAKVIYDFIGDDFYAWTSPDKAHAIALNQIKKGADVLFPAAGGSSIGGLKAADEKKIFSIGVDTNRNYLYPKSILTSVMVRVDNAAYRALMASYKDVWRDQMKVMGLQEKGVELAFDKYNEPHLDKALKKTLQNLEADIILKKINLPNYSLTNECVVDGVKIF
jgi:basic membrane protein A and related proteins